MRYLETKLVNFSLMVNASTWCKPCLTVGTALYVIPFEEEWYGAEVKFIIPFFSVKTLNSSLVKDRPLSVTMLLGIS